MDSRGDLESLGAMGGRQRPEELFDDAGEEDEEVAMNTAALEAERAAAARGRGRGWEEQSSEPTPERDFGEFGGGNNGRRAMNRTGAVRPRRPPGPRRPADDAIRSAAIEMIERLAMLITRQAPAPEQEPVQPTVAAAVAEATGMATDVLRRSQSLCDAARDIVTAGAGLARANRASPAGAGSVERAGQAADSSLYFASMEMMRSGRCMAHSSLLLQREALLMAGRQQFAPNLHRVLNRAIEAIASVSVGQALPTHGRHRPVQQAPRLRHGARGAGAHFDPLVPGMRGNNRAAMPAEQEVAGHLPSAVAATSTASWARHNWEVTQEVPLAPIQRPPSPAAAMAIQYQAAPPQLVAGPSQYDAGLGLQQYQNISSMGQRYGGMSQSAPTTVSRSSHYSRN